MRILWIVNFTFPEAQVLLSGKGSHKSSGGWLLGAANALVQLHDVELSIASLSTKVDKITKLVGERITYYLLPYGTGNCRENHDYEPLWRVVRDTVNPDVVHIHGTEYTHGLAYINACGVENVCVSIQGLVSVYSNYYYSGLTRFDIRSSATPASIVRKSILDGYRDFKRRGKCEIELIKRVHHIIGRTSWDRAHSWAINPNAIYHHGGEILRQEFYNGPSWSYEECAPHSIFISQAGMPIKGLHQVLKAMPWVLSHYPDTTIRVAGYDISRNGGWKERIKLSDYGAIVKKLINKYELKQSITFTGPLDGEGMKKEYLGCNVFICPSSIENSPNSLGEAQILGVPVLASYVGGVMDMMYGDESHLYRYEEVEMLAYLICDIFAKKDTINTACMREEARRRHDPRSIVSELLDIYESIIER